MRRGAKGHAARWRGWFRLGLLVTLVVLGHDLGMAGLAPVSELRFAPALGVASGVHVMHLGGEGSPRAGNHQQPPSDDEPPPSGCAIAWAVVRAGNGSLVGTLLGMLTAPAAIGPPAGTERVLWGADAPSRTPHEERVFFQVFLI